MERALGERGWGRGQEARRRLRLAGGVRGVVVDEGLRVGQQARESRLLSVHLRADARVIQAVSKRSLPP